VIDRNTNSPAVIRLPMIWDDGGGETTTKQKYERAYKITKTDTQINNRRRLWLNNTDGKSAVFAPSLDANANFRLQMGGNQRVMTPTKEQIKAALRYADDMGNLKYEVSVLAAAYREKCEELDEIKNQPREIICTKCGLREELGEKPNADF